MAPGLPTITLVGYPLGWIGRAEHVRGVWRALDATGVTAALHNAGGYDANDPRTDVEFLSRLTDHIPPGIRIYSLNGDQAESVIETIEARAPGSFQSGYNIVFPSWELPRYPPGWAEQLERFDEVWAGSPFEHDSIRGAVAIPVFQMPHACEPHISEPHERSHFGIPDGRFTVLFFFDAFSYAARKNPHAVIETFRRLVAVRPFASVQLVIKLNNSSHDRSTAEDIRGWTATLGDRVTIIDATLTTNETWNLVRCCDCFLSLHRSEGFGRGPAEAMFFGKPAVATGWSGNMEYMNTDVACPVDYRLVPVKRDEYPHAEDQVWADADVGHAAQFLMRLIDNPAYAKALGERARAHMQLNYSDAAIGRRYRERLEAIARAEGLNSAMAKIS